MSNTDPLAGTDPNFFGKDSFTPFIGFVEDVDDPTHSGRVKCRCVGWHPFERKGGSGGDALKTEDLPWARVGMPTTHAQQARIGGKHGLLPGCWVIGFFLDGDEAQDPFILSTFNFTSKTSDKDNRKDVAEKKKGKLKSSAEGFDKTLVSPATQPNDALRTEKEQGQPGFNDEADKAGDNVNNDSDNDECGGKKELQSGANKASQEEMKSPENLPGQKYNNRISDGTCGSNAHTQEDIQISMAEKFPSMNNRFLYGDKVWEKYSGAFMNLNGILNQLAQEICALLKPLINSLKSEIEDKVMRTAESKTLGPATLDRNGVLKEAQYEIQRRIGDQYHVIIQALIDALCGLTMSQLQDLNNDDESDQEKDGKPQDPDNSGGNEGANPETPIKNPGDPCVSQQFTEKMVRTLKRAVDTAADDARKLVEDAIAFELQDSSGESGSNGSSLDGASGVLTQLLAGSGMLFPLMNKYADLAQVHNTAGPLTQDKATREGCKQVRYYNTEEGASAAGALSSALGAISGAAGGGASGAAGALALAGTTSDYVTKVKTYTDANGESVIEYLRRNKAGKGGSKDGKREPAIYAALGPGGIRKESLDEEDQEGVCEGGKVEPKPGKPPSGPGTEPPPNGPGDGSDRDDRDKRKKVGKVSIDGEQVVVKGKIYKYEAVNEGTRRNRNYRWGLKDSTRSEERPFVKFQKGRRNTKVTKVVFLETGTYKLEVRVKAQDAYDNPRFGRLRIRVKDKNDVPGPDDEKDKPIDPPNKPEKPMEPGNPPDDYNDPLPDEDDLIDIDLPPVDGIEPDDDELFEEEDEEGTPGLDVPPEGDFGEVIVIPTPSDDPEESVEFDRGVPNTPVITNPGEGYYGNNEIDEDAQYPEIHIPGYIGKPIPVVHPPSGELVQLIIQPGRMDPGKPFPSISVIPAYDSGGVRSDDPAFNIQLGDFHIGNTGFNYCNPKVYIWDRDKGAYNGEVTPVLKEGRIVDLQIVDAGSGFERIPIVQIIDDGKPCGTAGGYGAIIYPIMNLVPVTDEGVKDLPDDAKLIYCPTKGRRNAVSSRSFQSADEYVRRVYDKHIVKVKSTAGIPLERPTSGTAITYCNDLTDIVSAPPGDIQSIISPVEVVVMDPVEQFNQQAAALLPDLFVPTPTATTPTPIPTPSEPTPTPTAPSPTPYSPTPTPTTPTPTPTAPSPAPSPTPSPSPAPAPTPPSPSPPSPSPYGGYY